MHSEHTGPLVPGPRRCARRAGGALAFWIVSIGLLLPAMVAAGPLPRLALSVGAGPDVKSALTTLDKLAGAMPAMVVTPVLEFDLSRSCKAPVDVAVMLALTRAATANPRVLLHIRIRTGDLPADDQTQESTIGRCVADLSAALPTSSSSVLGVILEIGPSPERLPLLQFALASLVLQLKAAKPALEINVAFPSGFLRAEQDMTRRVTAYADNVGIAYGDGWQDEAAWARNELHKPLVLKVNAASGPDSHPPAAVYLDTLVHSGDTLIDTLWAAEPNPEHSAALCRAQTALAAVLTSGFARAPLASAPVSLRLDEGTLEASAFIDSSSPDLAFLVKTDGTRERPRALTASGPLDEAFSLTCRDARDGSALVASPSKNVDKRVVQSCSLTSPYAVVAIRRGNAGDRLYESVSVQGRGGLSTEEIVARWQQQREAQKRRVENYSAECLLTLHFEATAMLSGFDVTMQLRVFADRSGQRDWIQDGLLVNGVHFGGSAGFPLPQLEPEKVLTQPLELALNEKYRYTLLGTETIGSSVTYVVSIEPEQAGDLLFNGKVWIDGVSFRQVRMQLQQKGGRSNVQSSMETQNFELVEVEGGPPFNLMSSIYVQQVTNAAGRSFLVEKTYTFTKHQLNSPTFDETLTAARASDKKMFRDTDQGLRTLLSQDGKRVVERPTSKVKALIFGALYEGSYSFPIPLVGLSMVDFNFRKTGSQLSVFFAGPILAMNLSKQIGSRVRVGMDLALSAIPSKNRLFDGSTERLGEGLWSFEETTGLLANWQATTSLSLSASSYLSANFFRPTKDTDAGFEALGRGYTIQTSGEARFARNGFALTTTATTGSRFGWSDLGFRTGPAVPPEKNFVKYSGELTKQFYLPKFTKLALSASYYGGDRLDRFSRYQPSFLSKPRIHGVPNGTDAFDAVGVASVMYGFNVLDVIKVEGMYNRAWGQNRDESQRFKTFEGLELGLGTVGPWGTFVQGSVTYALQGHLDRYRSRWGVYLMVFRPFGR